MGRSIKTRIKENNMDIQHGRIKKSTIFEYSHTSSHHMHLEDSWVLANIPHHYKIKIQVALEIKRFDNNINYDGGLKLKEVWKHIFHHSKNN
jgi:hypothetical protein